MVTIDLVGGYPASYPSNAAVYSTPATNRVDDVNLS